MVVSTLLSETIRSHQDILKEKDNTKYMKKAMTFYNSLAQRATTLGVVVDMFVCSLDQIGVLEMRALYEKTGGYYVMSDSFQNPVFKESFKKFFTTDESGSLKMGFLGSIEVFTSKEFKVSGCIGHVTSLKKKANNVSETEIGVGGTNAWYIGGIDKNTNLAFYFDVVN